MIDINHPKVTIICLSWQHERYIKQCFESIIKQSFKNINVIYIDNNSTDLTYERGCAILANSNLKWQSVKRERNYGITENFNFALKECEIGELFCLLSTDDWLGPEAIQHKVDQWISDKQLVLIYSNPVVYTEDRNEYKYPSQLGKEGAVFDELLLGNFISAPGVLVNTAIAAQYGFFDENMKIDDWDLWLRMLKDNGRIGFVADSEVFYRRHSSNFSQYNPAYIEAQKQVIAPYSAHRNYKAALRNIDRFRLTNGPPSIENLLGAIAYFRFNSESARVILLSLRRLLFKK